MKKVAKFRAAAFYCEPPSSKHFTIRFPGISAQPPKSITFYKWLLTPISGIEKTEIKVAFESKRQ